MPLPETEQHRVQKLFQAFCEKRVPPHARDKIKLIYKVTGNKVVLIESRPYFDDPTRWSEMPIAQFEYNKANLHWTLYAYNRNDRRIPFAKGTLEKLINVVDIDTTGIFWG